MLIISSAVTEVRKALFMADLEPEAIVGDLDSLSPEIAERFADRLYQDSEQDTNDLTKAVRWCIDKGYEEIVILGATGKREDHTIANISLTWRILQRR